GAGACIWLTGALAGAILFYDFLHKPWAGSVFVMGSCRTLLVLAAGSAVSGTLGFRSHHELIVKAIALGGYIVRVTLVARHESQAQRAPLFPRIAGALALATPVIAGLFYSIQHGRFIAVIFATGPVVATAVALAWLRQGGRRIGSAVGLLLAGIVLVDAL